MCESWYVCNALLRDALYALRGVATVSRPSDYPSVRDVDVPWPYRLGYIDRNLIIRLISLRSSLLAASIPARETPPKFGWNRSGMAVLNRKPAISLKRGKIGPRLLWWLIGSCIRAFDWYQNRIGWLWAAITHSIAQNMPLSEPTRKI